MTDKEVATCPRNESNSYILSLSNLTSDEISFNLKEYK